MMRVMRSAAVAIKTDVTGQLQRRFLTHARRPLIATCSAMLLACGGGRIDSPRGVTVGADILTPGGAMTGNIILYNGVVINNFNNNETVRYPLPILYGLTDANVTTAKLELNGATYQTPVEMGTFKLPVLLKPGLNEITITTGANVNRFNLNYQPADNPKKVKMMVAIPADEEGRFLAEPGVDNSLAAAKQKLVVQALLMQSATAEMLYKAGQSHLTYALVNDSNGQPVVDTLRLPLTRAELSKKTDNELYDAIATTIRNSGYDSSLKYMVTMSFSNYVDGKISGHAALGGGFLGIFGSLHLHTCPNTLEQVSTAFSNTQTIDLKSFPDDSGGRMSYWANCATGMGASLHELGHTFDLPHTPTGIMSRGFDNFNRLFMLREPGFSSVIVRDKEGGAIWDPASVDILIKNEWLKK